MAILVSATVGGCIAIHSLKIQSKKKAKTEVDNFLNHYELIAISINQKILDEGFYKDWMRSTYIKHFKESKQYIIDSRKTNPNSYTEFQDLAEKWDSE